MPATMIRIVSAAVAADVARNSAATAANLHAKIPMASRFMLDRGPPCGGSEAVTIVDLRSANDRGTQPRTLAARGIRVSPRSLRKPIESPGSLTCTATEQLPRRQLED